MGMPQLVVTAVLVEGRAKSEVARDYGLSRRWVITLVQRYLAEGAGQPILVLVHDLHIRVLSTSGQLLRDLTLDPTRDYQPQART
jgi:hypothetical protein